MVFIGALLVLAAHPASWLARSWLDPSYDSVGLWVFAAVVALAGWSLWSPLVSPVPARTSRRATYLLVATAGVRLVGELLAVRTIGALALVIDVYALAGMLGLSHRRRAVSPIGLALLFAVSLPVERIAQRTLGYPLQLMSAKAACALLAPLHEGLRCEGTLIAVEGAKLSIDLPCSGAQGLVLLSALCFGLIAARRLLGRRAVAAVIATLIGAWGGNALRLFILAEATVRGVDVMAEPAHTLVGLLALAAGALPLLSVTSPPPAAVTGGRPVALDRGAPAHPATAFGLALAAVVTLTIGGHPIDASGAVPAVHLPLQLDHRVADPVPLSPREQAYFVRYGGVAAKARYGAHAAMVVRTGSPLRHLHAPDECLLGAGHEVRLVGVRARDDVAGLTAVYRSVDPTGAAWRVEVTFVDETGARATNPAHVAWRWLAGARTSWTMVQRISPWATCLSDPAACAAFDRALFAALDIPSEAP